MTSDTKAHDKSILYGTTAIMNTLFICPKMETQQEKTTRQAKINVNGQKER